MYLYFLLVLVGLKFEVDGKYTFTKERPVLCVEESHTGQDTIKRKQDFTDCLEHS